MGDEILLKEIGGRIQKRRKELHLTQENLAEQMDVSIQMISNLELGKKAIRPENLVKLCRVLQISADFILFGSPDDSDSVHSSSPIAMLSPDDQRLIDEIAKRLSKG